jgi:hypothetical protein
VAKEHRLPNLRRLDLKGNQIGPEGELGLRQRWGERVRL